jgi:signal transduction histidine kinase
MGEEHIPSSYSIESILEIIRDTLNEVRWLINYLRPKMLDEIGLLSTIQWHWRDFRNRHPDLAVEMNLTTTEANIPARLKLIFYRIIQEATNNIERHSQASRIDFELTRAKQTLQLRVRDDGIGFDVKRIQSEPELNQGLTRMKEYAELSGGRFALWSSKNQGTCIEAVWDLGDGQDFQIE